MPGVGEDVLRGTAVKGQWNILPAAQHRVRHFRRKSTIVCAIVPGPTVTDTNWPKTTSSGGHRPEELLASTYFQALGNVFGMANHLQ